MERLDEEIGDVRGDMEDLERLVEWQLEDSVLGFNDIAYEMVD